MSWRLFGRETVAGLSLFAIMLLPMDACAYDIFHDGVYYDLDVSTMTLIVVQGDEPYTGDVFIPDEIVYNTRTLPVTAVGDMAFCESAQLSNVHLPSGLLTIGDRAFYRCENLQAIALPHQLKSIGERAFEGCDNIVSLVIPGSVESIGAFSFSCRDVKEIVIEDSDRSLSVGNAPFGKEAPNDEGGAFAETAYIGRNLTIKGVDWENFPFGCNNTLQSVTIGSKVTQLKDNCFQGATALRTVIVQGEHPFQCSDNVFANATYINGKLIVPNTAFSAYKQTKCWSNFFVIERDDSRVTLGGLDLSEIRDRCELVKARIEAYFDAMLSTKEYVSSSLSDLADAHAGADECLALFLEKLAAYESSYNTEDEWSPENVSALTECWNLISAWGDDNWIDLGYEHPIKVTCNEGGTIDVDGISVRNQSKTLYWIYDKAYYNIESVSYMLGGTYHIGGRGIEGMVTALHDKGYEIERFVATDYDRWDGQSHSYQRVEDEILSGIIQLSDGYEEVNVTFRKMESTGIHAIPAVTPSAIYQPDAMRVNAVRRGVSIIRQSDGSVRKLQVRLPQ